MPTTALKISAAALAALMLAGPAMPADVFTPPEGCQTFLTVQTKSCEVAMLWRCDDAPEGHFWESLFTAEGLQSVVGYNRDYQWLDGVYMWDSSREELIEPLEDPISLDELLETGVDTFSFRMSRSDATGQRDIRIIGADQLTGEETEIDGVPLLLTRTQYQVLGPDGQVEYQARGQQYVSPDLRLFFFGVDEVIESDNVTEYDSAPVDIIFPGEPGFGETTPLYQCRSKKSSFRPGPNFLLPLPPVGRL